MNFGTGDFLVKNVTVQSGPEKTDKVLCTIILQPFAAVSTKTVRN